MAKNRRPQKKKTRSRHVETPRNEEFAMATITRHAAAARPIPSGKAYKRDKAGARGKDW